MASFTYRREVAAPPETVFEVVTDLRGYAGIIRVIRGSELEREGEPPPNGVGAIRILRFPGSTLREEVLSFEPPSRFSYTLLSGAPLRDHIGTVEVTPQGEGTTITYAVRTMPTLPLVGFVAVAVAKLAIGQMLNGIVAEAERRAAKG